MCAINLTRKLTMLSIQHLIDNQLVQSSRQGVDPILKRPIYLQETLLAIDKLASSITKLKMHRSADPRPQKNNSN